MSVVDRSVTPVLLDLLECVQVAMGELQHPPANISLRPGSVVNLGLAQTRDECCEGTAWVRVAQLYPSRDFPVQDLAYWSVCDPVQWAVQIELGVARCAPTPDPSELPSTAAWNDLSLLIMDDAAAMRRAVCCFTERQPDRMFLIGAWVPALMEGGCAGGAQTLTLAIGNCDCDDIEPEVPAPADNPTDAVIAAGVVSGGAGMGG